MAVVVDLLAGQVDYLAAQVRAIEDGDALKNGSLHPMVRSLNGVLGELSKAAKMAADAGVEARRVAVDEATLDRLAGAIQQALGEVDLSHEQYEKLKGAMERHLTALGPLAQQPVRELAA